MRCDGNGDKSGAGRCHFAGANVHLERCESCAYSTRHHAKLGDGRWRSVHVDSKRCELRKRFHGELEWRSADDELHERDAADGHGSGQRHRERRKRVSNGNKSGARWRYLVSSDLHRERSDARCANRGHVALLPFRLICVMSNLRKAHRNRWYEEYKDANS
jgi:hypothetical protein